MVKICILLLVCAAILVFGALGNECAQAGDEVAKKKVDGEKVSWAIVALTRKMQVSDSQRRNKAIAKFIRPYASKHNITVIFFSEVPCPSQTMDSWQKTFEGIAQVKVINTADRAMKTKTNENAAGFGYKYMCKFFSIDLYDYLQDFNYYLRCDTDCFFTDLNYDLFAWAEDNNLGYGYIARKLEAHKPTRETLPTWTSEYMEKCSIAPSAMIKKEPISTCFNFYNNFHIGRVSFFSRPDVKHFLLAVLDSGHISKTRWGDSTIQAYAVRIFMDSSQVLYVPDFGYIHGSHNKQVSTFNGGAATRLPQSLPPLDPERKFDVSRYN